MRIFDMTSKLKDGDHDVRPPLAAAHPAASAGCSLARRARIYSSWSSDPWYIRTCLRQHLAIISGNSTRHGQN